MAKKRQTVESIPMPTKVREELGIEDQQAVRFKNPSSTRWKEAVVTGENEDGSLRLWCGMIRSIMPDRLQFKTKGPRGGVNWLTIDEWKEFHD